ncbi:ribosome biogenesis protein SLX9-domain-containing protein [Sphaerosporella brunnea]|uniref:Ribosome biogenesis protein SLX9 n=1 Tax=Sphaerosporella brunnea TaxID=1250544 RepID=A0A5J5ESN1_9PEZI|nr:ribosome biogenesis protein SLX9-domain-containing protein [Sphaerosporella brunnea]
MGRANIRSKTARVTSSSSTPAVSAPRDLKKAARITRHAQFVSRIEKKSATATTAKRRRPSKKLLSTLDSLADALSDINASEEAKGVLAQRSDSKKVLKSRPGAMKRKERLVKSECERFGKNLAILETGQQAEGAGMTSWAKLRGFIGATLEKKEEFVEMEKAKETGMEVEV